MTIYNNYKKDLANQLTEFGLNPQDWKIRLNRNKARPHLEMTHHQDEEICLEGRITQIGQTLNLQELSLKLTTI